MAITRIVDSEDDSDEGVRRADDNDFIDDSEAAARYTAKEKGKGRVVTRQQNKDGNGNTIMMEAQDEEQEEEYDDEDDEDEDRGKRKAGGGAANGHAGGKATAGSSSRVKLAWEEEYSRSWDALTEDVHGSLEGAVAAFLTNSKRRRILRDTAAIQRGIIRHLYLVLDLSESMSDRDMRPSRLELMLKYSAEFVGEFFDQNPISQLAIIGTQNGMANRISALGGNPVEHLKKLQDLASKKKDAISGEPSLQNALNMARSGLAHLPTHGSREVVVIFGSLTTCDPGNIHDTIDALAKDRVRVNIIGLSAEMSICREICKKTRGTFSVCLNEDHFKDLFFESILPPASLKPSALSIATGESTPSSTKGLQAGADLMIMGFPTLQKHSSHPTLCACHSKLYKSKGYICPRCSSKLCEVPTECNICRLTIVSSPHLARSYRHLFPVGNWKEVNGGMAQDMPKQCFACSVAFPPFAEASGAPPTARTESLNAPNGTTTTNTINGEVSISNAIVGGTTSTTGRYQCPKCTNMFCIDCDIFVHQLGACPGCQ